MLRSRNVVLMKMKCNAFKKNLPVIFKRLTRFIKFSWRQRFIYLEVWLALRYHHGAETRPIEDMADKLMEQLQGEIWAIQNQEQLTQGAPANSGQALGGVFKPQSLATGL
jgi:hypothetical protein